MFPGRSDFARLSTAKINIYTKLFQAKYTIDQNKTWRYRMPRVNCGSLSLRLYLIQIEVTEGENMEICYSLMYLSDLILFDTINILSLKHQVINSSILLLILSLKLSS